jgi:hypothetical protein
MRAQTPLASVDPASEAKSYTKPIAYAACVGRFTPSDEFFRLGGKNKVVEADETYIGGKESNKHASKRRHAGRGPVGKMAVFSLVERNGETRSFHVANVTAATLRPIMVTHAFRSSYLMTDEAAVYPSVGREFAGRGSVNHSAEEYVRPAAFITRTRLRAVSRCLTAR